MRKMSRIVQCLRVFLAGIFLLQALACSSVGEKIDPLQAGNLISKNDASVTATMTPDPGQPLPQESIPTSEVNTQTNQSTETILPSILFLSTESLLLTTTLTATLTPTATLTLTPTATLKPSPTPWKLKFFDRGKKIEGGPPT